MSTPRWTPEEIAALEEGLITDAAERERLESAIAADPEAKALFDALRLDHRALDEAMDAGLQGISDRDFVAAVVAQVDEKPERSLLHLWRWALGAAVIMVALLIPLGIEPDSEAPGVAAPVAPAPQETPEEIPTGVGTREVASAPVVITHEFEIYSNAGIWAPEQVILHPSDEIEGPEIETVHIGVVVESLITDATGLPVQGAEVQVISHPRQVIATGHTNPDGTALLAAIEQDSQVALFFRATHPGYAAQEREISDWNAGEVLHLALPTTETLVASVVDEQGSALSGLTVRMREREQGLLRQGTLSERTDSLGEALFANLTSKEQVLSVFDADDHLIASAFVTPALMSEVEITVLNTAPYAIRGQVTGVVTGEPVSGARVRLEETGDHPGAGSISRRYTWSDADGLYEFSAVRPEIAHTVEVDYHVSLDGSDPWHATDLVLTADEPSAVADLVAQEPMTFTGRVIDATTGLPIPDLPLSLEGETQPLVTDAQGRLVVEREVWEGMLDIAFTIVSPEWQAEEPDPFQRVRAPIFMGPDPLDFELRLVPSEE